MYYCSSVQYLVSSDMSLRIRLSQWLLFVQYLLDYSSYAGNAYTKYVKLSRDEQQLGEPAMMALDLSSFSCFLTFLGESV